MLNFKNITGRVAYQDREGNPNILFGIQEARATTPLDFQFNSSPPTEFLAIKIDSFRNIIDTINLDLSLLVFDVGQLRCSGLNNYLTDLECGLYYFTITAVDSYQSEDFYVVTSLEDSGNVNTDIYIAGLGFYDNTQNTDYFTRKGVPWILFGQEFGTNTSPLTFEYISNQAVTSFKVVCVDSNKNILGEIDLNTNLIKFNGLTHLCDSTIGYNEFLNIGLFYYIVNDRYVSQVFRITQLTCWIIQDIIITESIEDQPSNISFNVKLTGIEDNLNIDIDITFTCGIVSIQDTIYVTKGLLNKSYTFDIPAGIFGACTVYISSNLCSKIYQHTFEIAPLGNCYLELESSGVLELESSGVLELENCPSDANIIKLLTGDDLEFISGDGIYFLN